MDHKTNKKELYSHTRKIPADNTNPNMDCKNHNMDNMKSIRNSTMGDASRILWKNLYREPRNNPNLVRCNNHHSMDYCRCTNSPRHRGCAGHRRKPMNQDMPMYPVGSARLRLSLVRVCPCTPSNRRMILPACNSLFPTMLQE